jgi:cholesterol oxidase
MRGYVTTAITNARSSFEATVNKIDDRAWEKNFEMAEAAAKAADTKLVFRLTIVADDVADFMDSPQHQARVEGYVDCPLFGTRRLVEEGSFNLFKQDQSEKLKKMTYVLKFTDDNGRKLMLDGFKMINDDRGFDVWKDTTTLFTSIREGWDENSPVIAEGIVHVLAADFMKQLTTFRLRNSQGLASSAALYGRFLRFFFGNLTDTYILGRVPGIS